MRDFDDVKLSWQGDEKTVPADRVFELVMRIEDALDDGSGVPVFVKLMQRGYTTSRLSLAYAKALQFAGFAVRPQDVYLAIEEACAGGDMKQAAVVYESVAGLLAIIAPNITQSLESGTGVATEKK